MTYAEWANGGGPRECRHGIAAGLTCSDCARAREIRCLMSGVELRAAADSKGPGTVVGYAAVFDKFSEDLGYFREKLAAGCFADALPVSDVRALANHDPTQLLGRAKARTLRMAEDSFGLKVEIDLPDTTVGRDTAESIRRGDMDGMSFAFTTDIDEWDWSGEVPIRTVMKVRELYDVGPVTYPAYTDTTAAMRSLDKSKPTPADPPATQPEPSEQAREFPFLIAAKARLRLAEATLSSQ
jgi:HK97 family phage prohead protease